MSTGFEAGGKSTMFDIAESRGVLILTLQGNLEAVEHRTRQLEYNHVMKLVTESDTKCMVFVAAECDYLDSASLGVLISLTTCARKHDGDAVLVGVTDSLADLLERLMLLEPDNRQVFWACYDSVDDACNHLLP
ncbi:MAG: STAS domain-containing protein [Planctomycetota bacterium]|jgi:anti-anti-sigma factor